MISLRPYQQRAVAALLAARRGIVQAPAGSGKTLIGAAALAEWASASDLFAPTVVWLANTQEQLDQARSAVALFPVLEAVDLHFVCFAADFMCYGADLVIVDECHHIAAPQIRRALDGFCGVCWGLSATPRRADEFAADVFDLIGPIVCKIEREELISAGNLSAGRVVFHTINEPGQFDAAVNELAATLIESLCRRYRIFKNDEEMRQRCKWRSALKICLLENSDRFQITCELARAHSVHDNALVIVYSIDYGKRICENVPDAVMVSSRTPKRKDIIESFRRGDCRCLVATSLADEGLDIPRANVLILAAGGRSAAKIEQRSGRVLRPFAGKTHGLIYDFWDQGHYLTLAQSKARQRVYEKLGYQVSRTQGTLSIL